MIDLAPFVQRELWIRRVLVGVIVILAIGWALTLWSQDRREERTVRTEERTVRTSERAVRGWYECQAIALARLDTLNEARRADIRALFGDRVVEP